MRTGAKGEGKNACIGADKTLPGGPSVLVIKGIPDDFLPTNN